jgi:hypothetical protein
VAELRFPVTGRFVRLRLDIIATWEGFMGIKKLARYSSAVVLCFMLYGGATIEAQNKTAAPSITVYQAPT